MAGIGTGPGGFVGALSILLRDPDLVHVRMGQLRAEIRAFAPACWRLNMFVWRKFGSDIHFVLPEFSFYL